MENNKLYFYELKNGTTICSNINRLYFSTKDDVIYFHGDKLIETSSHKELPGHVYVEYLRDEIVRFYTNFQYKELYHDAEYIFNKFHILHNRRDGDTVEESPENSFVYPVYKAYDIIKDKDSLKQLKKIKSKYVGFTATNGDEEIITDITPINSFEEAWRYLAKYGDHHIENCIRGYRLKNIYG